MPYLTTRTNLKLQLSPGLIASYDIQPGKGVGLFWDTTHTPDPHGGNQPQSDDVLFTAIYCLDTLKQWPRSREIEVQWNGTTHSSD